jgi:hypothetical protein
MRPHVGCSSSGSTDSAALALPEQLRQPRDVDGDAPRLVCCQDLRLPSASVARVGRGRSQEHIARTLRCHAMPTNQPYRRTPELPHLPVPAAPTLTQDGRCSACHGVPTSICQGEVQVCRGCLAVLWHLRRPAAPKPSPKPRAPSVEAPTSSSEPPPGNP